MSTPNSKPADFFLRIPKCEAYGTNWSVYKSRFKFAADATGMANHLLATYLAPTAPTTASPPTPAEAAALEAHKKELKLYKSGQAIVKQAIASTIPDALFLHVNGAATAVDLWKKVSAEFEKKSKMVTVDLRRRLQDERCNENANVRTHLEKLQTLRTNLIGMGADPGDENFTAIILGSLPPSYDPYLSAITAMSTLLAKVLSPDDLIHGLNEEADRCSLKNKSKKDDRDIAFSAGERKTGQKKGSKSNIECYNCHKKGHVKADCWSKGGGKEGTGPRQKGKGKGKDSANTAAEKDDGGVWMVQVESNLALFKGEWESLTKGDGNTSQSSAGTAGCWLSDYNDEDFFEDEEDGSVSNMASVPTMEDLLAMASGTADTDNIESEYSPSDLDGIDYFLRLLNSESDSEDESMPDLQCMSDSNSKGDSMPDLQSVANSSDSEEEANDNLEESDAESLPDFFSAYSDCKCDENISRTALLDGPDCLPQHLADDMADWVEISVSEWLSNQEDHEEEKITSSFDSAMLANDGGIENVKTELYDSGASRHMSPYRHKFLNYTSIPPKSITAADKGTSQAIGQGDM
jgi:hypothetical protein